ncbi:MarR family winged helix-turn-helix transcriptional regulator [Nocardia thailandica]
MAQTRMIGYQIKRLDQLVEETFDRAVGETGLTRRQWQLLTALGAGPRTEAELTDALRPFWEVNAEPVRVAIEDVIARGWAVEQGDRTALTEAGSAAHAGAADAVHAVRTRMTEGVSADEFVAFTAVLARLIANLEAGANHS